GDLSDRKRLYVMWENRSQIGLNYSFSYSQVDKHYASPLGFEARNDYRSFGDRVSWGWFTKKENAKLRYLAATLNATAFFTNSSGELESFLMAPSFMMEWVKNNSLTITYNQFRDRTLEACDLDDDIVISADNYINRDVNVLYQSPTVNFLSSIFEVTTGTFYGGGRFSGGITPIWTINKYLTLSGFYQFNGIVFSDQPDYMAHVARLKVATSLNVRLSINAFVQLNTLNDISAINFRLRYNPRDGNDLYVVY